MVVRNMPRVQAVVLPLLRAQLVDVLVTSWIPDVDQRTFPLLNVRRLGGTAIDVARLDRPSIEVRAIATGSLADAENLYLDARQVLRDAVNRQTSVAAGYLHSFTETVGPTPLESTFDDTWLIQGVIQLGVRPPR